MGYVSLTCVKLEIELKEKKKMSFNPVFTLAIL